MDGSRCSIDGMWYKPQDSVVVLDAAIGKYKAKYLFLANDEVSNTLLLFFVRKCAFDVFIATRPTHAHV